MYEYRIESVEVIDGDTVRAMVDFGREIFARDVYRLAGVNAPERNTPEGIAAKQFAQEWIDSNSRHGPLLIRTIKDRREKYGRYLANIVSDVTDKSLTLDLLAAGHAKEYRP